MRVPADWRIRRLSASSGKGERDAMTGTPGSIPPITPLWASAARNKRGGATLVFAQPEHVTDALVSSTQHSGAPRRIGRAALPAGAGLARRNNVFSREDNGWPDLPVPEVCPVMHCGDQSLHCGKPRRKCLMKQGVDLQGRESRGPEPVGDCGRCSTRSATSGCAHSDSLVSRPAFPEPPMETSSTLH